MPMGQFADWDECKKAGHSDKYCGHIMHQVEGKTLIWTEVPLLTKAYKDSDGKWYLAAYISSTGRDRDGDVFSKHVLNSWANTINAGKINFGSDHSESWKDTMGVWKNAQIIHNPTIDIDYLYAEALLEDPSINKNVELLIHKADIGEQISLSIAANPPVQKGSWYETSVDKEGRSTRIITQADLLKADVVGEPSNPDARFLGIELKHNKENGCDDTCPKCFFNKKTGIDISKMPHKEGYKEDEEEEKEKKSTDSELEKFIENIRQARKSNVSLDIPTLVTGVLGTVTKAPAAGETGALPETKIIASPGTSGLGPTGNAPQPTPAPSNSSATQNVPNEPTTINGSTPEQPVPAPANLSAMSNVEGIPTTISATASTPILEKKLNTVFASRERLETLRKNSQPKNEPPGELLPLASDNKEVNKVISQLIAEQVKKQYSVEELTRLAESGQLLKQLDPNGLFVDAVKTMGKTKTNPTVKKINSIFLQKRE